MINLKKQTKVLLVAAGLIGCISASAQVQSGPKERSMDIGVTFNAARANTVPTYNFWMQGGGLQAAANLTHHWAAAVDVSDVHTGQMPHVNAGLDLLTLTFGPRYSVSSPSGRLKVYGQGLGGYAHGSNSLFPNSQGTTTSANGVALLVGGGMDYRISPRFSVRMIDADWLRTALSNGTTTVQNNLRLGSGVALHF